jgi:hypothetical protein
MISTLIKKKNPILDMGAAHFPYPRATHAMNNGKNYPLTKEEVREYKNETNRNLERKMDTLDYRHNLNYNTMKLPWKNNTFKMIYSSGSLGTYGKLFAYKEAYRVLQHGGKLKFNVGTIPDKSNINGIFSKEESKQRIKKIMQMLYDIGFRKIYVADQGFYIVNNKKYYTGWIISTKP